jgi:NADPH:quinone reductase-like Zn-dependent oxidoreductase
LGCDFAGQIEAAGPAVTRFAAGDQVFGTTAPRFGAHAQYACLSEQAAVAPKPASLTYAEAAALVDGTALCFLRDKANLQRGQTILINGASGAVGSTAVQLAKHFGATVTGVCSGASTELARKLGADTVIDYTAEDFTQIGQTYDVIFDVAGQSSFSRCCAALNRGGVYLTTAPSLAILLQMPWTSRFGARRAVVAFTGLRAASEKPRTCCTSRNSRRPWRWPRSSTRPTRCGASPEKPTGTCPAREIPQQPVQLSVRPG